MYNQMQYYINNPQLFGAEVGGITPIVGNPLVGSVEVMVSDFTGGIVFGDTSSIDVLQVTPDQQADMDAAREGAAGKPLQAVSILSMFSGKGVVKETANVTKKLTRYDGPKPSYHVNPAHVPGQRGFNPKKTPLPNDAESVFKNAVPNDPKNPTAWFSKNNDGQVYRFSTSNDGTAHFSGIDGVNDGLRNLTKYAQDRLNGL